MLTVLEVRLWRPATYKWKILGVGEFEYYKSMGWTTKRGKGGTKFLEFSGGKQKREGKTIFDLFLVGGKTLEETMTKVF